MPISPEKLRDLQARMKTAQEAIKVARLDLNDAKRAGIDVADQEKDLQRMETALRGMSRVYGATYLAGRAVSAI